MVNRKNSLGKYGQRGSIAGVVLALLILASVFSIGSQLAPLYLDHHTMVAVMEKMSQQNDLALQPDANIRETMRKRLKMNDIRKFDLKSHLDIARGRDGTDLVLDYEVRIDLFANLNLIAAFEKKVPLRD